MIEKLKLCLGLILLVCVFLPVARCEQEQIFVIEAKPDVADSSMASSATKNSKPLEPNTSVATEDRSSYLVPIAAIKFKQPATWLIAAPFIWVLPFLFVKHVLLKTKLRRQIAEILELTISGYSVFLIYDLTSTSGFEPMFWGYVAISAIILYLILHLIGMVMTYFMPKLRRI